MASPRPIASLRDEMAPFYSTASLASRALSMAESAPFSREFFAWFDQRQALATIMMMRAISPMTFPILFNSLGITFLVYTLTGKGKPLPSSEESALGGGEELALGMDGCSLGCYSFWASKQLRVGL